MFKSLKRGSKKKKVKKEVLEKKVVRKDPKRAEKEAVAMEMYETALKEFERRLGDSTTYSDDLQKIGEEYLGKNNFVGVLCSDQLDIAERAAREGICYSICNLDTTAQPGSHWVGLFATSDKGLLVYDSFGRCHRKILPFGSAMVLENTDMDKEQRDSEKNCGARTLAWLMVCLCGGVGLGKMI